MKPSRKLQLLLPTAAIVAACGEEAAIQAPPPPPVIVSAPLVEDVIVYEVVSGKTEPFESVEVRARVQGVLLEVLHEEGLPVKEGDAMFRIDPEPFIAARDAATAQVNSSVAQAELADITASKLEKAYGDRAISELQALEARAKHKVAVENVEVARKNLAIKQLDVSYTEIAAPISGRAVKSDFFVGSLVGGFGSSELTTMVDDSRIRAWFTLPDKTFLQYVEKHGAPDRSADPAAAMPEVELAREIDEGFPIRGRVDYADPEIDIETGTMRVRAVFDNADGRLRGGLFVRIRLEVGTLPGALVIPEIALGTDQQGKYILVVGDGDIVERREISLGPRTENGIVVAGGLAAGERVIVQGMLSARPGAKVTPRDLERADG